MADTKTVIIPLNGKNYPTWKIQCHMALIKDGLWGIVQGTEVAPGEENAEVRRKYLAKRDRALAVVVLSVVVTKNRDSTGRNGISRPVPSLLKYGTESEVRLENMLEL